MPVVSGTTVLISDGVIKAVKAIEADWNWRILAEWYSANFADVGNESVALTSSF